MKLIELLREKAKIESLIRQERVMTIRQILVTLKSKHKTMDLMNPIIQMEGMIASVYYSHADFDDVLDIIEGKLGL